MVTSWLFTSNETGRYQIHVISRPTNESGWGTQRQLTFAGGQFARWSPDGRKIAYVADGGGAVVVTPKGGDFEVLSTREYLQASGGGRVEWSPDGKVLYYKGVDAQGHGFWAIALDGSPPRRLVRFDDASLQSARRDFATDGRQFFFSVNRSESDIWVMEVVLPD